MNGVLLCGHGSRSPQGATQFAEFAARFKTQHPDLLVELGFLELSSPSFNDAIARLYEQGARNIVALPVFLFVGVHILEDIPNQLQDIAAQYPDLHINIARHIGQCDELSDFACILVSETVQNSSISSSHLLVVGVGASVQEANQHIHETAAQIAKKLAVSSHSVAFVSPMAKPSIEDALLQLENSMHDIIIVPLILFGGVYLQKIADAVAAHRANHSVLITPTLGNHQALLEILNNRLSETQISICCKHDGSQLMGLDCCGEL